MCINWTSALNEIPLPHIDNVSSIHPHGQPNVGDNLSNQPQQGKVDSTNYH